MSIEEQFIRDQVFVAASQTDAVISSKKGSILQRVIIIPATTSPGQVLIQEGDSGTNRIIFTGGAASVADLTPIVIEYGGRASLAGFRLTTGANVSVIAIGKFTAQ